MHRFPTRAAPGPAAVPRQRRCLRLALALGLALGAATADAQNLSVSPTNPLGPKYDEASGFGISTNGQFQSSAIPGGGIARPPASAGSTLPFTAIDEVPEIPKTANRGVLMTRVVIGSAFSGGVTDFFVGDVIAQPTRRFTDQQDREVLLRREPVRADEPAFLYAVFDELGAIEGTATLDPATDVSEDFLWSPHVDYFARDAGDFEEVFDPRTAAPGEVPAAGSERRQGHTFAVRGGGLAVFWRTTDPIATEAGSNQPIYGVERRDITVSSGTQLPTRKMFWTEVGFDGPVVSVPGGEVSEIRFGYHSGFPELVVVDENQDDRFVPTNFVGNPASIPRNTLWLDTTQDSIKAYNLEGRVLIELLGEVLRVEDEVDIRRHIGFEIVDVVRQVSPVQVALPIGERLYPLSPADAARPAYRVDADGEVVPGPDPGVVGRNLARFIPNLVINTQDLEQSFTQVQMVDGQTAYFAVAETFGNSDIQVYWNEAGAAGIEWPQFLNTYSVRWPKSLDDYELYVRPTDGSQAPATPALLGDNFFELLFQDDRSEEQAAIDLDLNFTVALDASDPTNRSLLVLRAGDSFWYLRVESVLDTLLASDPRYGDYRFLVDPEATANPLTAVVGRRLEPPPGADSVAAYIDPSGGDAYSVSAYIDPFEFGVEEAEAGAVIPVNATATKDGRPNDELAVWWFERLTPPAGTGDDFAPAYLPSYFARYRLQWPEGGREVVLASNRGVPLGSPGFPVEEQGAVIYRQPDAALHGYNPNEEHAQILGGTVYALRDDLAAVDGSGVVRSSAPCVIIEYPDAGGRPQGRAFPVVRESGSLRFRYAATAGTVITPPSPLDLMPKGRVPGVDFPGSDPFDDPGAFASKEVTRAEWIDAPSLPDGVTLADKGLGSLFNADFEWIEGAANPFPSEDARDAYIHAASFSFEDRKGARWAYRGPHDPAAFTALPAAERPRIALAYFYNTLAGFDIPDWTGTALTDITPVVGSLQPYLRQPDGSGGFLGGRLVTPENFPDYAPQRVEYLPAWPTEVPELFFTQTLTDPAFGLPAVRGQKSVGIVYQQSDLADFDDRLRSVTLFDPTVAKKFFLGRDPSELDELPPSIATSMSQGRVYFQNLPSHLVERFFFDPLEGEKGALVFQGEATDFGYLLLNTASEGRPTTDLELLIGLAEADSAPVKARWEAAVRSLAVELVRQAENPEVPGTYIPSPAPEDRRRYAVTEVPEVFSEEVPPDSLALSANGPGSGYVSLIFNNGEGNHVEAGEPVSMGIIRVGVELNQGRVFPVVAANPLVESVSIVYDGDFAAAPQDFEFEWRYQPPDNGLPPAKPVGDDVTGWLPLGSVEAGKTVNLFGGAGFDPLLTLTDNYTVLRYRPTDPAHPRVGEWSEWTEPALVEGWIKRVLAGINPFNQRLQDFFENAVDTDTSLLTQAGPRWEGDIPLNLDAVADAGLIEIYETVLNRGIALSIDGTPAKDYGPANDALLLVSGYLNDLYVALGNEAFADASNPLIAIDNDPSRLLAEQGLSSGLGETVLATATARFAFEGQVPDLLEEQLVLLRGRDDFLAPGARVPPVYNRFFWNFTRGIDAGEAIYALNYNIKEKAGDAAADGKIDAADARRLFPQGHGDAWGHYLTAIKNYYRLLADPEFTWTPRIEAVNILGSPVSVDYLDERKFASAGEALGRTAAFIIDLERRRLDQAAEPGWEGFRDGRENPNTADQEGRPTVRDWGLDEWASRAGQGNYLHWVTANALLPEDASSLEGIQRVDRTTVPELDELAGIGDEIQQSLDEANAKVNALGLGEDSVLFDISPGLLDEANETHFDQVLGRAKVALQNVSTAFERTKQTNALLRNLENQADDTTFTVSEQERAFRLRLEEIFGRPYAGDLGPGKFYPQGYDGPDLLGFMIIDRPFVYDRSALFGISEEDRGREFRLPVRSSAYLDAIGEFDDEVDGYDALIAHLESVGTFSPEGAGLVEFVVYSGSLHDGPYLIADNTLRGRRSRTGRIQVALEALADAEERLFRSADSLDAATASFRGALEGMREDRLVATTLSSKNRTFERGKLAAEKAILAGELLVEKLEERRDSAEDVAEATKEALPTVTGLSNDVSFAGRAAALAGKIAAKLGITTAKDVIDTANTIKDVGIMVAEFDLAMETSALEKEVELRSKVQELEGAYEQVTATVPEFDAAQLAYRRAYNNYVSVLTEGNTVLAEREAFRKRAAAIVQGQRTRDVGFRAFRNEALEQYKVLFDQAAQYAFLAAKAYDYETGLLGTADGRRFFGAIVASQALGLVGPDGQPLIAGSDEGDPGLSSLLAKLEADWSVAKGRLGFNNPDPYGTTFSLRREHFRVDYDEVPDEDHSAWQAELGKSFVRDLTQDPDVMAHALQLSPGDGRAIPGFVIPFSTTIAEGKNFFGHSLKPGDSAFPLSSFATKIFSVGVVFDGYQGMDHNCACDFGETGPVTHTGPDALSATPYCYLLPIGLDVMRSPALGDASDLRRWDVEDHALPLPFNIGASPFNETDVWTSSAALTEPFFAPRKHQAFRAVERDDFFLSNESDLYTNRRLIGRSVWNTHWKLVVPGYALLADPEEGMERFIRSVKDIKLYLRTYSYAGN